MPQLSLEAASNDPTDNMDLLSTLLLLNSGR